MSAEDAPASLEEIRRTAEYAEAKRKLSNREWRLDNLYYIRDETGQKIPFVRNEAQRAYTAKAHYRDVIPKARKLGFSTYIAILILDDSIFRRGTVSGIVDLTMDDAEQKLKIIKYAYEALPQDIRDGVRLKIDNQAELEWTNGSRVSVGTSYRGGTPFNLHVSEYGKISVNSPDKAREIKTGGIQAVPLGGKVWIESTAHGTSGEFYDMVKRAQDRELLPAPLNPLDFRSHFYGWWIKKSYRLPTNSVTLTQELLAYFEELKTKYKIKLDGQQAAFYAQKYFELGPDDVKQEFPSVSDELFYNSLQGTYFKNEINRARREGRIGLSLPHDPTRSVYTAWDIGENMTSIWWIQTDGVRHRWIDYHEEEGGSIQSAAAVIDRKRIERGFIYAKHFGPHDIENRDWGNNSKTRYSTALELGIKFTVVPRVQVKADSIEAMRRVLNLSWFDHEHCAVGVQRLEEYRKKWNKTLGVFMSDPLEDIASHGSDAGQQYAMGISPERPKDARREPAARKGSAWGA